MDSNKSKNFIKNLKYLIRNIYKWDKGLFGIFTMKTAADTVQALTGIILIKFLIDELTNDKRIDHLMFIIISAAFIILICNLLQTYCESTKWYRFVMIRLKFLMLRGKKLIHMDFENTENPAVLDKLEKSKNSVIDSISGSRSGMEGSLYILYEQGSKLLTIISYLVILLKFSPLLTAFVVLSIIAEYKTNLKLAKMEHNMYEQLSPLQRRVNYYENKMCDAKINKDIRIYQISSLILKRFNFYGLKIVSLHNSFQWKVLSSNILSVLINMLRYGLISCFLIYHVLHHHLSIGSFSMYLATVTAFSLNMTDLMVHFADLVKKNMHLNDYIEFMQLSEKNVQIKCPDTLTEYNIEFINVTFGYPGADKPVLDNFSLKINSGQKLALVGVNGCGKTTIIKLLTGLYTPSSGKILLNGEDISTLNKQAYFNIFSVIFQDINLFAWSIAENIALCKSENIDLKRLENSLKLSGLWDKVKQLENGYDSNVLKILDENGVEFSGGEAQKLALARALYHSGQVLVLDEPTASLDPIAEYTVYHNFNSISENKTVVYVSHRLSSTRFCDFIAYIEGGKVVEYGTHNDLLNLNGRYADMFQKQACYYQEESLI